MAIFDDLDGGWDDEPRGFWSVQTGKFIGRHGKGMVIPMVEIRWDGIRRRIELLLPLDQVEDKPW
jgi:hypothetical protein